MSEIKRFGDFCVEMGFCTSTQVDEAVQIQKDLQRRGFPRMLIGIVMVRYGILDNRQLIQVLKALEHDRVEAILAG